MRLATIALTAVLLAGCAQWFAPQRYAGISTVQIHFSETGEIESFSMIDGKEYKGTEIAIENAQGNKVVFEADKVEAFDAQAMRESLREKLPEIDIEPNEDLINLIVDLVRAMRNDSN